MRTVEKFAILQMLRLLIISGETIMGDHTTVETTLIINKFRIKLENQIKIFLY